MDGKPTEMLTPQLLLLLFQDGIPLRHFVTNVSNPSFSEALGFECLHKNVSHVLLCSSNIMGQYAQGLPPLIALSQQEQ